MSSAESMIRWARRSLTAVPIVQTALELGQRALQRVIGRTAAPHQEQFALWHRSDLCCLCFMSLRFMSRMSTSLAAACQTETAAPNLSCIPAWLQFAPGANGTRTGCSSLPTADRNEVGSGARVENLTRAMAQARGRG